MGPEARPRLLTSRSLSNEPVPECMNVTERWAGLARVAAGGEQSERQIRLRDPYVVVCGVRVVSTLPVEQEDVHVRLRIGCSAVPGGDVEVDAGHAGRHFNLPVLGGGLVHQVQPVVARSDQIPGPTDLDNLQPVEVEHTGVDRAGRPRPHEGRSRA